MRNETIDDIFDTCKKIKYLQTIIKYFTRMIEGTKQAIDYNWSDNEIIFACRDGLYDYYDCHLKEIKDKGFEKLTQKMMIEYLSFLEKVKTLTTDELNNNKNMLERYE